MMIIAYGLLYGLVTFLFFLFLCQTAQELPDTLAEYEVGPVLTEQAGDNSMPIHRALPSLPRTTESFLRSAIKSINTLTDYPSNTA